MNARDRLACETATRALRIAATALLGLGLTGPPAQAGYADAEDILEAGTLGGTRGLRLRQVGGNVLYSKNPDFVFYPASTIKVLQHLYAMSLVDDGLWGLDSMAVSVCTSAAGTNCSAAPNPLACTVTDQDLSHVLAKMMEDSSNRHTNALQEHVTLFHYPYAPPFQNDLTHYGRLVFNEFGTDELGLSDTGINHKFGCGAYCDNDEPSTMTLRDAERIYRAIAVDTSILSPAGRVDLKDHMRNESEGLFDDIVDQEAAATGKTAWKAAFRDRVYVVWKPGFWNCSGKTYRSTAGLVQLPTHNGAYKRLYTWGVFTHGSEDWAYLPGTTGDAVQELLRTPIRAALLTWGLGFEQAPVAAELRGLLLSSPDSRRPGSRGNRIRIAAGSLQQVEQGLSESVVDFGQVLADLANAHAKLKRARPAPGSKLAGALPDIAEMGRVVSLDAIALASTTSTDPGIAAWVAAMEAEHARGEALLATGSQKQALQAFWSVASMANPLVVWSPGGTRHDAPEIGFTGDPAGPSSPTATGSP